MTTGSKTVAGIMAGLLLCALVLTYHRTIIAEDFEIVNDVEAESEDEELLLD